MIRECPVIQDIGSANVQFKILEAPMCSIAKTRNNTNVTSHLSFHVFVLFQQADNLRQQTLHQMRRILTTRQAARCFLSIGEYYSRLRALSNLWASRPRE
jgi:hypothetical protein